MVVDRADDGSDSVQAGGDLELAADDGAMADSEEEGVYSTRVKQ
jgi:hypothetical protein